MAKTFEKKEKEKMKKNIVFYSIAFFLVGAATFVTVNKEKIFQKKEKTYDSVEMVAHAAALIKTKYVDEVKPERVFDGALLKMGEYLDFLSSYLSKAESEKLRNIKKMGYTGVKFVKQYGFPIVTNVLPSLKDKVKKGDIIKVVNGKSTFNIPYAVVKYMLTNLPGKEINVVFMRGEERKRIKLKLKVLSDNYVIKRENGWTVVTPLFLNSEKTIETLLSEIKRDKKIIVDLRAFYYISNQTVFKVVKYFIRKPVNITFDLNSGAKSIRIKPVNYLNYNKLILITDYQTMEEAELFASIAKKSGVKIVGGKTPGECGLMYTINYKDGTKFMVLTGVINELYKKGIEPDLKLKSKEIKKFLINPEKYLNGQKEKTKNK